MTEVSPSIVVFVVGTYVLRAVGLTLPIERLPGWLASARSELMPAIIAALVATATLAHGQSLTIDARLPAVVVAFAAARRGWPLVGVMAAATLTAAGLRLLWPNL